MGESASVLFGKWHRQVVPDDAEMRHLAGYPWQVAPPQSLLPFHRIDAFYFTLISRSTPIVRRNILPQTRSAFGNECCDAVFFDKPPPKSDGRKAAAENRDDLVVVITLLDQASTLNPTVL